MQEKKQKKNMVRQKITKNDIVILFNKEEKMNIKEYIYENGLTVKELASMLGITQPYLSAIITGRMRPGAKLNYRMKKFFAGEPLPAMNKTKDKECNAKKTHIECQ